MTLHLQRLTNHGRQRIIATRWDTSENVAIEPGKSAEGCFRSIWHGDSSANYTVEPVDGELTEGGKR